MFKRQHPVWFMDAFRETLCTMKSWEGKSGKTCRSAQTGFLETPIWCPCCRWALILGLPEVSWSTCQRDLEIWLDVQTYGHMDRWQMLTHIWTRTWCRSHIKHELTTITLEAKKDRCVFHKELKVRYKSGSHMSALILHALFVLLATVNTCLQYCLHSSTHKKVKPAASLASRSYYYNP